MVVLRCSALNSTVSFTAVQLTKMGCPFTCHTHTATNSRSTASPNPVVEHALLYVVASVLPHYCTQPTGFALTAGLSVCRAAMLCPVALSHSTFLLPSSESRRLL